ncbi:MAG: alpha/beta hydrolase [Microbacterium sp.]
MIPIPEIDDSSTQWHSEGNDPSRPLIVLIHGYGADEHDLIALASSLPTGFDYAAVRGPLTPPFPMPGCSWYPLEGEGSGDIDVVTESTNRLLAWLDSLGRTGPVGLVGFSQGGVLAVHAMRLRPEAFAFAGNLSGYVMPGGEMPGDETLAERRPPVFWGRGSSDDVIPEGLVVHTTDWLPGHADIVGRTYLGLGHAVAPDEVADLNVFLTKQLEALGC